MSEYLALNHMELVPIPEEDEKDCYYIPHHCVFKRDSGKIRVVFNASQPCSNGQSLNSCFLPGPNMQDDVFVIILQWLFAAVAATCDIVKMYRQFLVHAKDREWQRIFWQESLNHSRKTFRLSTVTYGESCASFQTNACMRQLANDGEKSHPRATKAIRKKRYTDDFYLGEDTVEELREARDELLELLSSAGMEVGKWASNSPEILQDTPLSSSHEGIAVPQNEGAVSTLGLRWLAAEDAFCFKISNLSTGAAITKRAILADVAKLLDLMGFLFAVIITGKIIMQNLWILKLSWDETVPEKERAAWLAFRNQLPELEEIRIPRWTGIYKHSIWDFHCFCDASERAYAALVYVTVHNQEGFSSRLLTAKAKVAPVKVISLPKLELCGALLLSRLLSHVIASIESKPSKIYYWTDSRIVLAWLQGHPSRWPVRRLRSAPRQYYTAANGPTTRSLHSASTPLFLYWSRLRRAISTEGLTWMRSKAFLAAYRRFVARRGLPSAMYSDNSTTFKGADVMLRNLFKETSKFSEEVAANIAKDRVQWSFIPPRAPNFGGLWESNVRSFKRHLFRVIGEAKLTYEEFSTVAASIEACLNSRPLSVLSQEAGDLAALTPGHFLVGAELMSQSEPFTETNERPTACSRWHMLTLMKNHFWQRWHREFLHHLQQRSKWLYPNCDFSVGDLVLFKNELLPPTKWPLGRIIHLYDGPDGLSRVSRIKTVAKEYTRPLNKLVRLPVNEEARSYLVTVGGAMAGSVSPDV